MMQKLFLWCCCIFRSNSETFLLLGQTPHCTHWTVLVESRMCTLMKKITVTNEANDEPVFSGNRECSISMQQTCQPLVGMIKEI